MEQLGEGVAGITDPLRREAREEGEGLGREGGREGGRDGGRGKVRARIGYGHPLSVFFR